MSTGTVGMVAMSEPVAGSYKTDYAEGDSRLPKVLGSRKTNKRKKNRDNIIRRPFPETIFLKGK